MRAQDRDRRIAIGKDRSNAARRDNERVGRGHSEEPPSELRVLAVSDGARGAQVS